VLAHGWSVPAFAVEAVAVVEVEVEVEVEDWAEDPRELEAE
jgi:hypothetical protein